MEELIFLIVQELYGEDPAHVAKALYIRNKSTLKQLQTFLHINDQALRNAIIILMQQLIVSFIEAPKIVYMLNEQEVLQRIRYPRYIRLINMKYGEDSCIEDLLENGCCSINQLIESAKELHRNPDSVGYILREMIHHDYMLPVDRRCELKTSSENNQKKQGKPTKKVKIENLIAPILSTALPKNKSEVSAEKEIYYRLNANKLNKEMQSELIGGFVSSKLNMNCSIIAEVMFKLGYRSVTRQEILAGLPASPKISNQILDSCLEMLEKADLIEKDTEISWKLNLHKIHNTLIAFTIEKILQGKFGGYSSRVFRILFNKGLLDEKTISELSLLPLKDTNISLNELFSSGFIYAKTVGNSQMYYGVKIEEIRDDVLKQCYKSVHNLKIKLSSEMEEVWGLAQRAGFLTSEERQTIERYNHIESRIESAILELDRTILLLTIPISF
ncbi:hypothetical protein SteCoe_30369 [Stentor coeruleus]|uniref:DNA-directed RNA polymerase III subunit RPC3 n=1 Tax=Stentor coeruleus TaxID=5963 RepID=A0A1R2B3R9_9CILI|nr:hypothetical protein SteCoe_30369 [Stentor coeruleus]